MSPKDFPEPFPIGSKFAGTKIVAVLQTDEKDPKQPYQYYMADGSTIWIYARRKLNPKTKVIK